MSKIIGNTVGTPISPQYVTLQMCGAKGDGVTDDTNAFQFALANNRKVYVPGGTYKLSSELKIRDNCELELAQDAVLVFTQTTGNCITLNMSSSIKGNHATIKVPYEFSGNVIYASTTTTESVLEVPPFTKWGPQWKSGRYVTDINICKADYRGFHYSVNGDCSGTAVYLAADGASHLTFMWGVNFSGLRVAGAFEYGIRAVNFNKGWLHEMRVDGFVYACETGVSLEDCDNAYISAIIQPAKALNEDGETYVPYAKHGIKLVRSKNVDLSGSRIWDWNAERSLYGTNPEYKFLSMYGECRGAIVNAFQYYEESTDIRNLIYTDTASNLEQINILQEPFTRWFKNRNGAPYFFDGFAEKKLTTEEEMEAVFDEKSLIPRFTNQLPIATDTDGTVYNGKGYKSGVTLQGGDGKTLERDDTYYISTIGFIPVSKGAVIRTKDMRWLKTDGFAERIVFYDNDKNIIKNGNYGVFVQSGKIAENTNYISKFADTDNGFEITLGSTSVFDNLGYIRISLRTTSIGADPVITVDEEIAYSIVGTLSDKVKVKAENIIGLPEGSGVDVTAEVGQTIVAKEVDGNGKPTKWESADYQPRTHWEEKDTTVIIPEQEFTFTNNTYQVSEVFPFVVGEVYNVYFDDIRYVCRAVRSSYMGLPDIGLGNEALVGGINTGEPFAFGVIENIGMSAIAVFDTETTHKIKVTQSTIKALDSRYYSNDFCINLLGNETDGWTIDKTAEEIVRAHNSGKNLMVKHTEKSTTAGTSYFAEHTFLMGGFARADTPDGSVMYFKFKKIFDYNNPTVIYCDITINLTDMSIFSVSTS
jgi:hypothetical protein